MTRPIDLLTASEAAWKHLDELRGAWQRGAIRSSDGQDGLRSNTNVEAEVGLREAIAVCRADQAERAFPVDAKWLRSIGAVKEDHPKKWRFDRDDALSVGLWCVDDGWKVMLILTEQHQACVVRGLTTRGQVLDLLNVLGIGMLEQRDEERT